MLKFFFIPILALAFACVPQGVNSSHLLEQLDEEALNEELSEACLGTTQCSLGKNFSCRGRVVCDFGGGRVHAVGSRLSVEAKTYTACEDQLFELSQPLQRQYLSCPNTLRVEQIYFNNQPLAELKKAERQKTDATKQSQPDTHWFWHALYCDLNFVFSA